MWASGKFRVDSQGRVWSGNKRAENRLPSGYLQVRVMIDGVRFCTTAHRLVWRATNGPIPHGMIVNHKNGIKDDNRPENLELNSNSENTRHANASGLRDQRGEKNPSAKLTDTQAAQVRLAYAQGGYTQAQLAEKFGVSHQAVSKIVRGQRRASNLGPITEVDCRRAAAQRDERGRFVGKKAAGRLLDGREHNELPQVPA